MRITERLDYTRCDDDGVPNIVQRLVYYFHDRCFAANLFNGQHILMPPGPLGVIVESILWEPTREDYLFAEWQIATLFSAGYFKAQHKDHCHAALLSSTDDKTIVGMLVPGPTRLSLGMYVVAWVSATVYVFWDTGLWK